MAVVLVMTKLLGWGIGIDWASAIGWIATMCAHQADRSAVSAGCHPEQTGVTGMRVRAPIRKHVVHRGEPIPPYRAPGARSAATSPAGQSVAGLGASGRLAG